MEAGDPIRAAQYSRQKTTMAWVWGAVRWDGACHWGWRELGGFEGRRLDRI